MERARSVQLPADPPRGCETCGEPLVVDAGEFLPIGQSEPIHVVDGRPYCPNGHETPDLGGEG